jgi:hypothetical protein
MAGWRLWKNMIIGWAVILTDFGEGDIFTPWKT